VRSTEHPRLRIVSDLHTEFHADRGETLLREVTAGEYDVLVVAGDMSDAENLPTALEFLCLGTGGRPIVYVLGNHEYYGSSRPSVLKLVRDAEKRHPHLHFLDTRTVDIDGCRFLGTTLWFRQSTGPEWAMNDFSAVQGFRGWVYQENRRALALLEEEFERADVVVTHHLPHRKSVAPEFAKSELNRYFVCEVPELRHLRPRAKLWVHGHTHSSLRYRLGGIQVVCNPFGYALQEENRGFDPGLTVEAPLRGEWPASRTEDR
jgi:predicted MPP superfamily phosphohydrolase